MLNLIYYTGVLITSAAAVAIDGGNVGNFSSMHILSLLHFGNSGGQS